MWLLLTFRHTRCVTFSYENNWRWQVYSKQLLILSTTSSHNLDVCYDPLINYIEQTVNTLLLHYVLTCIIYSNHLSVQGLIIEIYLTDRSYTSLSTMLITFYLITFLHAKLNLMHKKYHHSQIIVIISCVQFGWQSV